MFVFGCPQHTTNDDADEPEITTGYTTEEIQAVLDNYARPELGVPQDQIPEEHLPALREAIKAAQIMSDLFWAQTGGLQYEQYISDPATRELFEMMYGPWNRSKEDQIFSTAWGKDSGATFYPMGFTREEGDAWLELNPSKKHLFLDPYTLVRQEQKPGPLEFIPYSEAEEYEALQLAATHLDRAAELAVDDRLKTFFEITAKAFRTNDYQAASIAWMKLGDGDLEIVIGPTEAYEDLLYNSKAAFGSYVCLRDPEVSQSVEALKSMMPELERALPIEPQYQDPERSFESSISVVDLLYASGDSYKNQQAMAFNLPNDEWVRENVGTKNVLLRNVMQAKFDLILRPIAEQMVAPEQVQNISFDAFFLTTLLHEIGHGLGPTLTLDGRTLREAFGNLYFDIEETKADCLGVALATYLIDQGVYPEEMREQIAASNVAGLFRSLRFGLGSAHATSTLIQYNFLVAQGAIWLNEDGLYTYNPESVLQAHKELAHHMLMLEVRGDRATAEEFLDMYKQVPEGLEAQLASLGKIPVDIYPRWPILDWIFDE